MTTVTSPPPLVERSAPPSPSPLPRLLSLLLPYRRQVAWAFLAGFVGIVLNTLAPLLLGRATDLVVSGVISDRLPAGTSAQDAVARLRAEGDTTLAAMYEALDVIPGQGIDFSAIGRLLSIGLLLYAGVSAMMLVQARIAAAVTQHMVFDIRERVEDKLSRLPVRYFDSRSRGELLSRVTNDVDNLQQALQAGLVNFIAPAMTVVAVLVLMFSISLPLALITLVLVPVSALTAALISRRAQPRFAAQWDTTGSLNAHIEDVYAGQALVTAFDRRDETEREFRAHNEALYEAAHRAQFLSGTIQPAMMCVNNLNYVLVAVVGAAQVISGALTLGSLQAFTQFSSQFGAPLGQLASTASLLQSGLASATRVFEFLDEDEESDVPHSGLSLAAGRIRFEDVSFRYDQDVPLIEHLSLEVDPGQTVAIVGPTGAGKTTLCNLLMRFYDVSGGRITLDGVDLATMSRAELRSRTGLVLQETWLFGGTIAENIAYGREGATREDVVEAARSAYADRFVRTLPDGYDTVLDDEDTAVSAGEKQLITVARAFLAKPSILLLDEATSSVDTRSEVLVQRAMRSLRTGRTSFVIAHRLSTIRDADVILVMESGRIVERGTHEELLAARGAYSRLHAAQFAGTD